MKIFACAVSARMRSDGHYMSAKVIFAEDNVEASVIGYKYCREIFPAELGYFGWASTTGFVEQKEYEIQGEKYRLRLEKI